MLRSRRRSPYGAYFCAVISAVLLLLSVSLLHSRLSRSHPHPLPRPSLSAADLSSSDDPIDDLDFIDETLDPPPSSPRLTPPPLFFFDPLSAALRRSFLSSSLPITAAGVFPSPSHDPSKTAFASDDAPVDSSIRALASRVASLEHALLLKDSPLRDQWGDWFDKKSVFLRKDRMFRSNFDSLNPLNNPLLQDPDAAAAAALTRTDRLVQKWWIHHFRKVPFPGVKKIGNVPTKLGTERRTLNHQNNNNNIINHEIIKEEVASSVTNGAELTIRKDANFMVAEADGTNGGELTIWKEGNFMDAGADGTDGGELTVRKDGNFIDSGALGLKNSGTNGCRLTIREDVNFTDSGAQGLESSGTSGGGLTIRKDVNVVDVRDEALRNSGTNGGELTIRKDANVVDASGVALKKHVYADGDTWGYYPGLPPRLSFNNFMDKFFRVGKCVIRVFMVWNSPPWMYTVRHQRGLESLLFRHPDACVVVFSETVELDFFKDSFVKDGYKVAVAMPNLDELLKGTPAHIFASVWFEWKKTKFYSTHYSELVRLAALYKYGGIYLDTDIIVLKSISFLNNSVGTEEDHGAAIALNGAVMAFQRHSLFIQECLEEFYMTYDDTSLRGNGADLLTRVAQKYLGEENKSVKPLELKVEPSYIFFLISSQNITRYFIAPTIETEKAQQDVLLENILHNSLTFHFWNSLTFSLIPEPDSLVSRLLNYACIRCLELL